MNKLSFTMIEIPGSLNKVFYRGDTPVNDISDRDEREIYERMFNLMARPKIKREFERFEKEYHMRYKK